MKYAEAIIATTHTDLHGDRMALAALESMVDQINLQYIPFGIEHDPRIAPQGRLVSAELVELKDGASGVKAQMELFETGESVEFKDDGRTIPSRELRSDHLYIIFDRSYRSEEDQQMIGEIVDMVDARSAEFGKKAADPLSILTIAVGVIIGGYFAGFFERAGADTWDFLKSKVKDLIREKRDVGIEHLLLFQFSSLTESGWLDTEVILTQPTDDEIEAFFEEVIHLLDRTIPHLLDTELDIRRIVLEYSGGRVRILYGVRSDGVPYSITFDFE